MKKNKMTKIILPGIICMLILAVSIWYSVKFNESRLVVQTDLSTYKFSPRDLPMICSVALTIAYFMYLLICTGRTSIQQKRSILKTSRTRKLNPKLGFLGFLGFMGFMGFWTYSNDKKIFPFMFFMYFGFFGFFYEGKMSNTFMDERFKENKNRAQLVALKTAFAGLIIMIVFLALSENLMSIEYRLIAVHILIALSIALALFLSEYLLYRYDHDEYTEIEEDTDHKYMEE